MRVHRNDSHHRARTALASAPRTVDTPRLFDYISKSALARAYTAAYLGFRLSVRSSQHFRPFSRLCRIHQVFEITLFTPSNLTTNHVYMH